MYDQLTTSHCIYLIKDDLLDTFKQEAKKIYPIVETRISFDQINPWSIALNIWCLLYENDKSLLMDDTKMLTFSSLFYFFKLLRNDADVIQFKKAYPNTPQVYFVLTYYLAAELTFVVRSNLEKTEEGKILNKKNSKRDYFAYGLNVQDEVNSDNQFFIDQKLVVAAIREAHTSQELKAHIQNALELTRENLKHLYQEQM